MKNIDSCLDPDNFQVYSLPGTAEKIFSAYLVKPKGRQPGKMIKWTNKPPESAGRQAKSDVITGRVGVKTTARTADKPRKAWEEGVGAWV